MPWNLPRGHQFFIGFYQAQCAIKYRVEFIHTDQSCFLSTHLFDFGYRVFIHFKSGIVTEVKLGENAPPIGKIEHSMNLERLLLGGSFGRLAN